MSMSNIGKNNGNIKYYTRFQMLFVKHWLNLDDGLSEIKINNKNISPN